MTIDILFLIMVFFGFYFGFTFGLVKVGVYVVALLVAIAGSMRLTPTTEGLIRDTFEVDSVYLPFFSFVITLATIIGIVRMVTRLLEGTIDGKKFNTISRIFGGILMSLTFLFLYSVLITFFSEAKVIKTDKNGNYTTHVIRQNSEGRNDTVYSELSFSYKYIRQIPEKGQVVLETVAPFVKDFVAYMRHALQAIDRRNTRPSHLQELHEMSDSTWQDDEDPYNRINKDSTNSDSTATAADTTYSIDIIPTVTAPKDGK